MIKSNAIDCTHADAKTVMSYFQRGSLIWLPLEKFTAFFKWINDMNTKQAHAHNVISDKHKGKGCDGGVLFQSTYYKP
jgi:hypothetical protein